MLRRIVTGLSQNVEADASASLSTNLAPALVSRRALATWAVACAAIIIPIGATLSPAWEEIQKIILGK